MRGALGVDYDAHPKVELLSMGITSIEWTDRTWNPTRGCSRVSPGCVHCYAESLAGRYSAYGAKPDSPFAGFVTKVNGHASWTGKVELVESMLDTPLHWRKPCRVFVNSMSDLFHEDLPDEAIDRVFAVMALCPQHTFQILTKRPERMMRYFTENHGHEARRRVQDILAPTGNRTSPEADKLFDNWPLPNVWLGVSVEDQQRKERIDMLRQTPAAVRFLSIEPLIEDIGVLDLSGISWVIIGGESGPGSRPFQVEWAKQTIEQCAAAKVACFVKQFGAKPVADEPLDGKSFEGRNLVYACQGIKGADGQNLYTLLLDNKKGGDWDEWPEWARVREFPYTSVRPGGVA